MPIHAVCLQAPFRWSESAPTKSGLHPLATNCVVAMAVYFSVELSWLLLFFVLDPSYPWFLWYTRSGTSAAG